MHAIHYRQHNQRGIALLAFVMLFLFASIGWLIGTYQGQIKTSADKQIETAKIMQQAKEALVAYAAFYDNDPDHIFFSPGYLPCPDTGTGGTTGSGNGQNTSCGEQGIHTIGQLPWQDLGAGILYDGDGNCLWYAVAGSYKNNNKPNLMNEDSPGAFAIYAGNNNNTATPLTQANAVAVVFSPGIALPWQNRQRSSSDNTTCGDANDLNAAQNFLESYAGINNSRITENGSAIQASSTQSFSSVPINDRLTYITQADIQNQTIQRLQKDPVFQSHIKNVLNFLTAKLANTLKDLPPPLQPRSIKAANLKLSDYGDYSQYAGMNGLYAGRYPYSDIPDAYLSSNIGINSSCSSAATSTLPSETKTRLNWQCAWKDHFFYYLAPAFSNLLGANNCNDSTQCFKINGVEGYAAVVIFAGAGLQNSKVAFRTAADKEAIARYIESASGTTFTQGSFDSTSNNDILCGIKYINNQFTEDSCTTTP